MKKTILLTAVALLLASCSHKEQTIEENGLDVIDNMIEQVKNSESIEDLTPLIDGTFENKLMELDNSLEALIVDGDSTEYKAASDKIAKRIEQLYELIETKYGYLIYDEPSADSIGDDF